MIEQDPRAYPSHRDCWVRVASGGIFHLLDPRAEEVFIEDIAHALSQKVRFSGHGSIRYTVGQHSIMCAQVIGAMYQDHNLTLHALLHDAAEAYWPDIPSPLKVNLPMLEIYERKIEKVIMIALGLNSALFYDRRIKGIDKQLLNWEGRQLFENWEFEGDTLRHEVFRRAPFRSDPWQDTRMEFLSAYYALKDRIATNAKG